MDKLVRPSVEIKLVPELERKRMRMREEKNKRKERDEEANFARKLTLDRSDAPLLPDTPSSG